MSNGARTITLPPPLYYTLPELCERWGCHEDRPFLYMDSGLLVPSALVPKHDLPLSAHDGVDLSLVLRTPCLGVKMHPEVRDGKKSVQSRVQA